MRKIEGINCHSKRGFYNFLEDDQDDTNEEVRLNWWQIWNY